MLEFFNPDTEHDVVVDYFPNGIAAGLPTPSNDFRDDAISLDRNLVRNKATTFYARVSGQSMINAGLDDGDLLVVDRALPAENNKIAVCCIDGEFTVKRLLLKNNELYLMPENDAYTPIKVNDYNDFRVWGIVTYVVKKL